MATNQSTEDPEVVVQAAIANLSVNHHNTLTLMAQLQTAKEKIQKMSAENERSMRAIRGSAQKLMQCLLAGSNTLGLMDLTPEQQKYLAGDLPLKQMLLSYFAQLQERAYISPYQTEGE